jgi:hypothetical protein
MIAVTITAAVLLALVLAYMLHFTNATLEMGRSLSATGSKPGLQDAITPPWQARIALLSYLAFPCLVALTWWQRGWVIALGVLVTVIVATFVWRAILPAPSGGHYRAAIARSMLRRYSEFVRKGDLERAEAMRVLLVRAGIKSELIGGG